MIRFPCYVYPHTFHFASKNAAAAAQATAEFMLLAFRHSRPVALGFAD
jgi:hypothetical protein